MAGVVFVVFVAGVRIKGRQILISAMNMKGKPPAKKAAAKKPAAKKGSGKMPPELLERFKKKSAAKKPAGKKPPMKKK